MIVRISVAASGMSPKAPSAVGRHKRPCETRGRACHVTRGPGPREPRPAARTDALLLLDHKGAGLLAQLRERLRGRLERSQLQLGARSPVGLRCGARASCGALHAHHGLGRRQLVRLWTRGRRWWAGCRGGATLPFCPTRHAPPLHVPVRARATRAPVPCPGQSRWTLRKRQGGWTCK